MPQVRKPEVDERIRHAALERFAADGYARASMAAIAAAAGVSPGNIYRYYPDGKAQLFEAVVTDQVAQAHERLVTQRVHALLLPLDDSAGPDPSARQLLAFWVEHRLEVVILLGRAAGTRFEGYGHRFSQLLVDLAVARLEHAGADITPTVRQLLEVIFANTRRAIVAILAGNADAAAVRHTIAGFWSYQLPGLDGFYHWALKGA